MVASTHEGHVVWSDRKRRSARQLSRCRQIECKKTVDAVSTEIS